MKKIDSKDKASRTYGQNEKIWYLCMPYSFLNEEHTLDLDAEMGDRGLIIYFRLLMMATASQGVLKLDTRRISPLQRLAGRLQHRYTENEIAQVLEILDENNMVKIIEGGEEIKFRDVYEMAVEKQRRAAEKRKAEGTAAYEGEGKLEDEPEDEQEQPEETETKPEKKKKPAPVRHKYGEYNNVLLSDEEMEKLKSEFPNDYQKRIEDLSGYMESNGKSYKNHLATIRNWARRDGYTPQKGQQTTQTQRKKPVSERLIDDKIIFSHKAPDIKKWDSIKETYNETDRAEAEKIIKNEAARW